VIASRASFIFKEAHLLGEHAYEDGRASLIANLAKLPPEYQIHLAGQGREEEVEKAAKR
jgi:hypothetical protein